MYLHFCLILSDSSKVLKEIIGVFIIHMIFPHKAFLFLLFMFWEETLVVQRNGAAQKNYRKRDAAKQQQKWTQPGGESSARGSPVERSEWSFTHMASYIFW